MDALSDWWSPSQVQRLPPTFPPLPLCTHDWRSVAQRRAGPTASGEVWRGSVRSLSWSGRHSASMSCVKWSLNGRTDELRDTSPWRGPGAPARCWWWRLSATYRPESPPVLRTSYLNVGPRHRRVMDVDGSAAMQQAVLLKPAAVVHRLGSAPVQHLPLASICLIVCVHS